MRRRYLFLITAVIAWTVSLLGTSQTASADPAGEMPWHLTAMQAERIWEKSKGRGITVAVIDGGVDGSLPELEGRLTRGKNLFSPKKTPYRDLGGHGTSMAALIAGTGRDGGIQGLAPEVKIMPITVSPGVVDFFSKVPEAIDYAVKNGADIINMSFGAANERAQPGMRDAIDRANKAGVLLFAGSGNDGSNATSYPAGFEGVVAVGATDRKGRVAKFSQHGGHLALAAPGEKMPMRCQKNTATCQQGKGTSAATAIASASAALIWSKHPDWTANQVLRVLIKTAGKPTEGKIPSKYLGYGTVRPRVALTNDNINPGDPNKSPLFSKYYAKNTDKESAGNEVEEPEDALRRDDEASSANDSATAEESGMLGALIVGGAGLILLVGVGAVVMRRYRK